MNNSDYLDKTAPSGKRQSHDDSGLPGEEDPFWVSPADSGLGAIGERQIKRAFDQIVTSIHLDAEDYAPQSRKGKIHLIGQGANSLSFLDRTTVPDLDSPQSSTSSRVSFPSHTLSTPSKRQIWVLMVDFALSPSVSLASLSSPSRRANLDPPIISSPVPLSTKSFLDDDWLRDRVKHDSKMAQVAGGLVRSSSTPPRSDQGNFEYSFGGSGAFLNGFNSNAPPRDYICKLCSIPGHWLKDCHLYEPRGNGAGGGGRFGHTRATSMSSVGSRTQQPPGNYICRLCGVPGHWIEQCAKFQPKSGKVDVYIKGSIPPKNYICNLCHQPGHWIQQCSEFTSMPSHHKRSVSSERGRYF
ncbi:hypothetical protein PSACC_02249 [Paramicrosporidium saccamoebae]|uniref:CCHC-type domain-containing protein n=1 Tax=Paramicrosporidium saccamoebae TaxID=1246581 RepID=A0A2H9TJY8_9FUNG|nr:hypothetical protein PSACC_02249 [Paramicrosporidium saccamoebae]